MKKGRTKYQFELNCNMDDVNKIIKNFLNQNSFQYIDGDIFTTTKGHYFNYQINGNTLVINAWFKSFMFGELELEQEGFLKNSKDLIDYKKMLDDLFRLINIYNQQTVDPEKNRVYVSIPKLGTHTFTEVSSTVSIDPNTNQVISQREVSEYDPSKNNE